MANASSLGSTVTKVVELGLMFVATCFAMDGISPVHAQTIATEESNAAANSAHRVLIPANADKKPSGDKVYVPETFYRALYWAAASVGKPRGWLIRQARYQGDLTAETGQTRFAINSLRAVFDLEVFGRYTQVRIPLEYRHGLLSAEGVSLDGRPAPCQWESDALTLDIAEPGVYRLEIPLHPNITSEIHSMEMGVPEQVEPRFFSPTSGVNLAIPRISRSRLELNLPEPAPMIEVPSAVGAVTHENENKPSRLIAQLGPADRLTIRWQNKDTSDEIAPSVRAESRLWLKIQPGSLVIHAKFAFHVIEGHLQQAQIAVDPRLRLLPLSGDDPPTVHIRQEIEQSRIITFHWSRPIMDRATLETTFLLSGATGVGNFHLPRIELLNVPSVNRSMAVSVDPALDCDEQQTSGLEPITTYEFLKAWTGESDGQSAKWSPLADRPEQTDIAPPQSAYRLPAERIDWSISTRPHETRTVADQTLSVSCDLDHIDFTFEAQLSTASGYLFQHRFAAPKDCVIEAVSLLEGNVERAARWSRDEAGAVTIFLNNAVSGQQKLVARGRIAMPNDRPWNLPDLRLERCEIRSSNLRIFQRPGVQLAIEGGKPINGEKPRRETSAGIDLGHFVASYAREESDSLSVTAKVEESQSDPIARSPAESPDDKSTVKQAAKPHAGGMVQLADISTSWHDGGACFGKAVFHIDPQGSSECPLLLPAGYELIHVSVEGITVTLTETGDNAWRFPLVSPSLPQCVQVLYRTELRRGGRSKRSAMRSPAIADWTVRRTLWSVDGPPAWKACDPAESPSVESWRQEFQRLSSIAAMIETAATDPTNDPAEGPRWFLTWSQRFHASLSALRDELPTAKDVAEAAEAREKAGLIEKRVAGLARRLGLEISKAAPHVSRDVMAGSRAAVYCSMEGRVDALTFDCRGAEREDFSRWFLAAVAMTTLTLLVAQSRRSKLFAGRV